MGNITWLINVRVDELTRKAFQKFMRDNNISASGFVAEKIREFVVENGLMDIGESKQLPSTTHE